jgi:hypothetical protein
MNASFIYGTNQSTAGAITACLREDFARLVIIAFVDRSRGRESRLCVTNSRLLFLPRVASGEARSGTEFNGAQ